MMEEFSYIIYLALPALLLCSAGFVIYGLYIVVTKRAVEDAKRSGKRYMGYGAAVLLVTVLLWGGIGFTQRSLGLSGTISQGVAPTSYIGGYARDAVFEDGAYNSAVMAKGVAYPESAGDMYQESMPPIMPTTPSNAPAGDAKIIKSGMLTMTVLDVDKAANAITTIRVKFNGQPGNASFNEYGAGSRSGNITIWVPSESFDAALLEIKQLALKVNNENVNVSDVSAQFVDTEARLKNLRATEAQYVEIMKRSGTINEVLSVTRALTQTRQEIEQLQGQLNHLSRQVALSSISINLTQEVNPTEVKDEWRPITVIKGALKETLEDLTQFIDRLLVLLVKLPMLLLRLVFWGGILWVIWKVGRMFFVRLSKETALPFPGKKV